MRTLTRPALSRPRNHTRREKSSSNAESTDTKRLNASGRVVPFAQDSNPLSREPHKQVNMYLPSVRSFAPALCFTGCLLGGPACGGDESSSSPATGGSGATGGSAGTGGIGGSGGTSGIGGTGGSAATGGSGGEGGTGGSGATGGSAGQAGTGGAAGTAGESGAAGSGGDPGEVTTLASGLSEPRAIAIDDTSIYWAEYLGGTIMKVGKAGGSPVPLASGQNPEEALTVDGEYVYWIGGGGVVGRVAVAGGTPEVIATAADHGFTQQMAVNTTHIYWVFYRYSGMAADGALLRVPIDGGAVETLATVDGRAYGVALDAANVYWSNSELDAIMRLPLSGGSSSPLVTTSNVINANVQVDAANVYFNDVFTGRILKGSLGGGTATKLAEGNTPMTVAIDDNNVYWVDTEDDGAVRAVSKSGGAVATIASSQARPRAIAVDDDAVYWSTLGVMGSSEAGTVMKATK